MEQVLIEIEDDETGNDVVLCIGDNHATALAIALDMMNITEFNKPELVEKMSNWELFKTLVELLPRDTKDFQKYTALKDKQNFEYDYHFTLRFHEELNTFYLYCDEEIYVVKFTVLGKEEMQLAHKIGIALHSQGFNSHE